jgi:ATP-dependent DNA helicase RecG
MQAIDAEVIAENHRTIEEKLASLRCFDLRSKAPTVAGILLFGTDPQFYLPVGHSSNLSGFPVST